MVECLRPERFVASGARTSWMPARGSSGNGETRPGTCRRGRGERVLHRHDGVLAGEMYVGYAAREVIFRAQECSPCIVWIDEIDAVARQRGGTGGGMGNEERETTLNELLSAMDGFAEDTGVVVLAATNRADVLDEALLRPGRFDRRIPVTLPEAQERRAIRVHTRDKTFAPDVDLTFYRARLPDSRVRSWKIS